MDDMNPFKDKRALVVGGAGSLGSTILNSLLDQGAAHVTVIDDLSEGKEENLNRATRDRHRFAFYFGSITDPRILENHCQKVDYVFHTASYLFLKSQANHVGAIQVNVGGTLNVLKACELNKVKKLVFTSSASVFGEPQYTPVDEKHPFLGETIYSATKICGEQMVKDFARRGLSYSIIRPYNIIRPAASAKNGAYSQVIPRWIEALDEKRPIVIHGDGEQTMDLVHVDDVAQAHLLAAAYEGNEDFNIGSGVSTSANELAHKLLDIFGLDWQSYVSFVPTDANVVKTRRCAIGKAKKLLGWEPRIDLDEGLQQIVAYYRAKKQKGMPCR